MGTDPASMQRLLGFLTMAFNGGTDVDAPLALSLTRITQVGYSLGGGFPSTCKRERGVVLTGPLEYNPWSCTQTWTRPWPCCSPA